MSIELEADSVHHGTHAKAISTSSGERGALYCLRMFSRRRHPNKDGIAIVQLLAVEGMCIEPRAWDSREQRRRTGRRI